MSTDLAVPPILLDVRTGEALEPSAENAAAMLAVIRDQRRLLKDAEDMCRLVLRAEARRRGTKTFRVGGLKAEVNERSELVWDIEILRELQRMGLPEDRWADLVTETVDYKVSAVVAKQLEANNPDYARVIEAARKRIDKPAYVSVTA